MKKIFALLLTLAMLISLAACGGSAEEDPNAGKYLGTTAKALGMTMEMSEIYPGETWLELKSGGKGTIMLDGDSFPMKWALDGTTFTLTIDGVDSVGKLSAGVITIDLMAMGVEMTFVMEGVEAPVAEATYNDAGYWEIVRVESDDPEANISEEDMEVVKAVGVMMYMELLEDGTGVLFMDEAMPITWQDGSVTFTEDALTVSYTAENSEIVLDMFEAVFVLRKGEKPAETEEAPVVQSDDGYYELIRIDSNNPDDVVSESDIQLLKNSGNEMYLELLEDGTGTFYIGYAMSVVWGDGTIEAENEPFPYTVDGDELFLGTEESMFVFRRSEK